MTKDIGVDANIQKIRVQEISSPSTPASGYGYIYAKTDGLYFKGDNGTEIGPLAATGTDPNHAYYQYLAASLEPLAIEKYNVGTFTYTVSSSETKIVLGAWYARIGAASGYGNGRLEIRDPRQPMTLRDCSVVGQDATYSYLIVIDPALPTYSNARATYFNRLQTIAESKTMFAKLSASSNIDLFLPGPYGNIVTSVTGFNYPWVGFYLPNGGTFNLADEVSDSTLQRIGHSLMLPISKNFVNALSGGAGSSFQEGGVTHIILPSTWGAITDSTSYIFRDDFMVATLDTSTKWTKTESTAGNVQIDTNYQWLKLIGNGSWGNNGAVSQTTTSRANGKIFICDIYPNGATSIVGWHDGAGVSYTDFSHGVFFGGGNNINIYEAGTDRGNVGSWVAGRIYRVRVTLGASNNATYEIQGGAFNPIGGTTWSSIQPGTSSNSTTPLAAGVALSTGTVYISDVKIF